jgi:hypothetical protein
LISIKDEYSATLQEVNQLIKILIRYKQQSLPHDFIESLPDFSLQSNLETALWTHSNLWHTEDMSSSIETLYGVKLLANNAEISAVIICPNSD